MKRSWWYPAASPLVLASRSPRRRDILTLAGIPFLQSPEGICEEGFNGTPAETVSHWARRKAEAAAGKWPGHPVLGADTLVSLGDELLGKPSDPEDAMAMLRRLSGRWHTVFGGVCIIWSERSLDLEHVEETRVLFRELGEDEIRAYVDTGEPMDKAGSYGIQGIGSLLVRGMDGCYFNVMGLPIAAVMEKLREKLEGSMK